MAYAAEFRTDWLEIPLWVWSPASNVHRIVKRTGYLMRRSLVSLPDIRGQLRTYKLVYWCIFVASESNWSYYYLLWIFPMIICSHVLAKINGTKYGSVIFV